MTFLTCLRVAILVEHYLKNKCENRKCENRVFYFRSFLLLQMHNNPKADAMQQKLNSTMQII